MISGMVSNNVTMIIALTAQEIDGSHVIIGCVIFHPDNNVGCFVPYLAVQSEGGFETGWIKSGTSTTVADGQNSWRNHDIGKFLLSMVQITATMLYLCKQEGCMPSVVYMDPNQMNPTSAHHLYLQVRLEEETLPYSLYVGYGFESLNANRISFICKDYKKEVGVGVGS